MPGNMGRSRRLVFTPSLLRAAIVFSRSVGLGAPTSMRRMRASSGLIMLNATQYMWGAAANRRR